MSKSEIFKNRRHKEQRFSDRPPTSVELTSTVSVLFHLFETDKHLKGVSGAEVGELYHAANLLNYLNTKPEDWERLPEAEKYLQIPTEMPTSRETRLAGDVVKYFYNQESLQPRLKLFVDRRNIEAALLSSEIMLRNKESLTRAACEKAKSWALSRREAWSDTLSLPERTANVLLHSVPGKVVLASGLALSLTGGTMLAHETAVNLANQRASLPSPMTAQLAENVFENLDNAQSALTSSHDGTSAVMDIEAAVSDFPGSDSLNHEKSADDLMGIVDQISQGTKVTGQQAESLVKQIKRIEEQIPVNQHQYVDRVGELSREINQANFGAVVSEDAAIVVAATSLAIPVVLFCRKKERVG